MGTDIVIQCVQMPGITVAAIADNHLSNGYKALAIAGRTAGTQAEAATQSQFNTIVESGLIAMSNGKHLVMMNVEADVTIGAYLAQEAAKHGVVYTLGRVTSHRHGFN